MRRWELVSQFLWPQLSNMAREVGGVFGVPFLGAYFVPVFGAGHIDARSRGSFFGPAIRTPIQGQKQSSERASWPAF